MVQHTGVYVAHRVAAASNDEKLKEINDFCRMKKSIFAPSSTGLDPKELKRVPYED